MAIHWENLPRLFIVGRPFDSIGDTWGDRFVWLYPATGAVDVEEVGIMFVINFTNISIIF